MDNVSRANFHETGRISEYDSLRCIQSGLPLCSFGLEYLNFLLQLGLSRCYLHIIVRMPAYAPPCFLFRVCRRSNMEVVRRVASYYLHRNEVI